MAHKPLPIFSNMPWHVKQKIVDFTDPITQRSLQICSKELQRAVNKAPSHYNVLNITLFAEKVRILLTCRSGSEWTSRLHRLSVSFEQNDRNVVIVKKSGTTLGAEENFLDEAIKFLGKIFPNTPRKLVTFQEVDFAVGEGYDEKIYKFILKARITFGFIYTKKVELCSFPNDRIAALVLRAFHPGTLKTILLYFHAAQGFIPDMTLAEVIATEQWMLARELTCRGIRCMMSYDKWEHLEVKEIAISTIQLSDVKDIIHRFGQSPNWDKVTVYHLELAGDVFDYFSRFGQQHRNSENENHRFIHLPHNNSFCVRYGLYGFRLRKHR